MRTPFKVLLPVLVLLTLPALAQAQFAFTTNNGTITITDYTGTDLAAVIPSSTNGYPVTSIGDGAFYDTAVISVLIPDSVTNIGDSAFYDCLGLSSIAIPNGVSHIGGYAFYQCINLTNVTIPESVTSIGDMVFAFCHNLDSITVDGSNRCYSSAEGLLFDKDKTRLIQCPVAKVGDYAVPDGVTNVESFAFATSSLKSITIPDSVTSIGDNVFFNCCNLTNVTILGSLGSIESRTFYFCVNLRTATIPSGVTSIGDEAFSDCYSLSDATIPDSVNSIGSYAFFRCRSLASVTIGNNVTDIGTHAFFECTWLSSVGVADSVTNIGSYAFYGCSSLSSLALGNHVTSIEDLAFAFCGSLSSVTLPGSVSTLGDRPFYCCSSLAAINVDALNALYSSVDGVLFDKGQTTLILFPHREPESYVIPNGVGRIEPYAFDECGNLTNVTLPGSLTDIGSYGFYFCANLTNLRIPNGVTNIGQYAFSTCVSLTNVFIPSTVSSIGAGAFYYCSSLKAAYFCGEPPWLGGAFGDPNQTTVYYLPGTTGWGPSFGDCPTALWFLPNPLILINPSFGAQTNAFGFVVSWATNLPVVVEGCTSLASSTWLPLKTNALTDGWFYFSDPDWTNYPARFYRIRSLQSVVPGL